MSEMNDGRVLEKQKVVPVEPIGIVVLGDKNPSTLTDAEFKSRPDLLFHGAAKPFDYLPHYDYSSEEYFTDADGSQTLGEGFYVAGSREVAANYSIVRGNRNGEMVVLELLPFQAKMLDLRSKENPALNATIPSDLFHAWFDYYEAYYKGPQSKNRPWYVQSILSDYYAFLIRAKRIGKPMILRVMLDTAPDPDLGGNNLPHPPYVRVFSNFMREQGYDGLIAIEGGEGMDRTNHASYVFFNLDKLGTHQSWQRMKQQQFSANGSSGN